jgi:hypothetical protein
MRALFVAYCLGLLVVVVASPVHARAFCKSEECQQTSARNAAPKHAATSVQKGARKHAATPVHKLAPKHTVSSHAGKHTAKKAASKRPVVYSATRSVQASRTVSQAHPEKSASQECAPSEACDDVVSGGSQLIRLAMEHLGANPTGWSHNWCGRFLAMTLEAAGHTGGGNLAAGYADYGLPAKAQVGAIAVMPHHVGIVTAVGPGYVVLLSGNHAHKVGVGRYASNKIIAYRMAA